jgi:hypothetical protein
MMGGNAVVQEISEKRFLKLRKTATEAATFTRPSTLPPRSL